MKSEPVIRRRRSRRDVLRLLAVAGATGAAWKWGLLGRRRIAPVSRARLLMGTGVHLTVLGDDRETAEAAADATLEHMANLEARLSRHRSDSELSVLNRTGRLDFASEALLDNLCLSERISGLGEGAFDITVQPVLDLYRDRVKLTAGLPADAEIDAVLERVDYRAVRIEGRSVTFAHPGMAITLDGIGKGYIIDRGVAVLAERGFGSVFVEAGGDLLANGRKDSGVPWRVGIRNPRPGSMLLARFDASNIAVATSGDYMQPFITDYSQHHILDPRTGRSAPELASSTVTAPDTATADALATLTMVLGPRRGLDLIESLPDCEACFVTKELEITRTSGFSVV